MNETDWMCGSLSIRHGCTVSKEVGLPLVLQSPRVSLTGGHRDYRQWSQEAAMLPEHVLESFLFDKVPALAAGEEESQWK